MFKCYLFLFNYFSLISNEDHLSQDRDQDTKFRRNPGVWDKNPALSREKLIILNYFILDLRKILIMDKNDAFYSSS